MSFTITRQSEQLPSYPMLCKLAEQNRVCIAGNERTGSFSFRGGTGTYEYAEEAVHGTFAGHGITGTFSFEVGKATVTVTDKPFWLPEVLLKQKIDEGLDDLCAELTSWQSS